MRATMLLIPTVWTIVAPGEQGRHVDDQSPRGNGRLTARAALVPAMADARALHAGMKMRHAVTAAPDAGYGPVPIPGMDWPSQVADPVLDGVASFSGSPVNGGLIDRLVHETEGNEGSAAIMPAGPGVPIAPRAGGLGRWSGTAWILWRPEAGRSFAQAPLLGGSQTGARIDYRLTSGRSGQLSLYGRVSRALTGASSEEGALGAAFRPGRLPVSLLAERRQRLGPGGRNGFALLAAGGVGPRDVAPRLEVEGYAQVGIVGLPGFEGFADGKGSVGYRLTRANEHHSVTLGASMSGSVQPGARRVDIGPELRVRLPLGPAGVRLSTEWRERIAGDARPARGPAVTLVAGF